MEAVRLNLGCGHQRLPGHIGVDRNARARGAQVICELERPLPFRDNVADAVVLDHALEHLSDVLRPLAEVHRVCKPGARVHVRCPHFSCAWGNPDHKSAISWYLFDVFQGEHDERFCDEIFRLDRRCLRWMRPRNINSIPRRIGNAVISLLANLHPTLCQRIWCYWVGGFEEIEFEVTVVKPEGRA